MYSAYLVYGCSPKTREHICSQTSAGALRLPVEGRTQSFLVREDLRGLWKAGLEKHLLGLHWMPTRCEQFGISETLVQ